jgi:fatty acid desaturase
VARSRKKKKKTIKFELTLRGLLGVGAVLFCIFLWVFLIGIWAGQTILLPAG